MDQSLEVLYQQATQAFECQNYQQAALLYEQLIEQEPDHVQFVWQLGLTYLLLGQEAEAQFTWMMPFSAGSADQVEAWTIDLAQILEAEADRQAKAGEWQTVWLIRQHLRELLPTEIHNLLHLVQAAIRLGRFDTDDLTALTLTPLLRSQSFSNLDPTALLQTVVAALEHDFTNPQVQTFAEAALSQIEDADRILDILVAKVHELDQRSRLADARLMSYLAEMCLRYAPNDLYLLKVLSNCQEQLGDYAEAVVTARHYLAACQTPIDQLTAIGFLCIKLLKLGSGWQEVEVLFDRQKTLIQRLITDYYPDPHQPLLPALLSFCCFYPYSLCDRPAEHRYWQNQLANVLQTDLEFQAQLNGWQRQSRPVLAQGSANRKLRIGYIARYMVQHSVGWLARWLMQHHNLDRFEIYTYHLHVPEISHFTNHWFVQPVTHATQFANTHWVQVAQQIQQDGIDILVDLDSITYTETCRVMALKPAPIQVTWLGFDASGIPAIDYFLADPYVLPDDAQTYYSEKIWRLPQTYVAVDGFELGIPTLRREELRIPNDAIVYFSAQDSRKRHPETIRLQIQILQAVPNSYLLIKGLGDVSTLRESCEQIAIDAGVSIDRLRFLERDGNELVHRANLGIADVVLDTFPYNGATTTLETLWMGIPLVTLVGEQFAARNSYSMMINTGITEGMAWTADEYVEWGVRLGQDLNLRKTIAAKLRQSRQTAPLWNTAAFVRHLEDAYQQMWQIYCNSLSPNSYGC